MNCKLISIVKVAINFFPVVDLKEVSSLWFNVALTGRYTTPPDDSFVTLKRMMINGTYN